MNLSVTINADNVAELHAQLQAMLAGMNTAATTLPSANAGPAETPGKRRGRPPAKGKDAPQISANPENRQETEDSPEEQAQDTADEKADTAAQAEPETVTHDHIRGRLGEYVKKFGMAAAQEDGPKLIQGVLKKHNMPTEGKGKISDLPDDPAVLKTALSGVDEMIAKNPFKREAEL